MMAKTRPLAVTMAPMVFMMSSAAIVTLVLVGSKAYSSVALMLYSLTALSIFLRPAVVILKDSEDGVEDEELEEELEELKEELKEELEVEGVDIVINHTLYNILKNKIIGKTE